MTKKKEVKPAPKTAKKASAKKAPAKKSVVVINIRDVGFKTGDVHNALAAKARAPTVAEIAKAVNISTDEVCPSIGWLFKGGKVKDGSDKVALA